MLNQIVPPVCPKCPELPCAKCPVCESDNSKDDKVEDDMDKNKIQKMAILKQIND